MRTTGRTARRAAAEGSIRSWIPFTNLRSRNLFPICPIGGIEIAFTNSALYMLFGLLAISLLMIGATRPRALVPGRMQALAEMSYEFVATTLRSTPGPRG